MKGRIFSLLACGLIASCGLIEQFTDELTLTLSRGETIFAPDPVWRSGDAVKLFSSTRKSGERFTLSSGALEPGGVFSGERPGSAPFIALYPASLSASYRSASSLSVQLPSVQGYVAGSFDAAACPYAASVEGNGSVRLDSPMSVLELPLVGDAAITSLSLITPKEHPLCGSAVLDISGEPALAFADNAGCVLTLDCGKGVKLSATPVQFRFVLPPAALAAGAVLKILDSEGGAMQLPLEPLQLGRGELRSLPQATYVQEEPPYLSLATPGLYSLAADGTPVEIYAYEPLRDQIGILEGSGSVEWRLQCLEEGKVMRVILPGQRGKTFGAQFFPIGISDCPGGTVMMTAVQRTEDMEWLLDSSGNLLLILKTAL